MGVRGEGGKEIRVIDLFRALFWLGALAVYWSMVILGCWYGLHAGWRTV